MHKMYVHALAVTNAPKYITLYIIYQMYSDVISPTHMMMNWFQTIFILIEFILHFCVMGSTLESFGFLYLPFAITIIFALFSRVSSQMCGGRTIHSM